MDQSQTETKSYRSLKYIIPIAIIAVGVLATAFLALQKPNETSQNTQTNSETKLYEALGNAAKQQKIRVGMYRETFAKKSDAEARKNIGTVASSVSEVDTAKGYRSVFAHNILQDDKTFSIGRCMDGTTYNDIYQSPAKNMQRAKTLTEAAAQLTLIPEGNLFEVTQPLTFVSCPHLGLLPASPPLAVARLSDGVFPVTLSDQQAKNWQEKVKNARLFSIKDEGMVERSGQKLRKFSFSGGENDFSVNQKLYDIFYETGEIAKLKSEQPKAEVDYEFQSINPNNTGSIGGYYLIDEARNLPVYSELYGTNPDKKSESSRAADRNIARTKQTYAYPARLTIGLDTPLEFLQ